MKKNLIKILLALVGVLIFGVMGLFKFINYGASNCDNSGVFCDCFCCHSFGLRGYEACGNYGFLIGISAGLIVELIIYRLVKKARDLKQ